ncbi:MAG: PAS domain-containing protein [Sporomusaceae bacterium]|nr:PAS domain-containing protein [Sporomusaceae bacterium]
MSREGDGNSKTAASESFDGNLNDERRRQEAYYRIMTEVLDYVVWRIDVDNMTVLDVSPSIKRLRGFEPAELIGRPVQEMVTSASYRRISEKLPAWMETAASADTGGLRLLEVVEQPHKDGSTVWTEMALCFFRRSDGGSEEIGISRNLGQQRTLADICRQLADSERFLQVIWDAAPCMLSCIDSDGRFLLINQRFAENRGLDRGQAAGMSFIDILPEEAAIRKKHQQLIAECLTGRTVEFLDQYRPRDAEHDYWSYGKYQPVYGADGKVGKIITAVVDVTEQQEMKRQLTEAEKIGRMGSWHLQLATGRFNCSDGLLALYRISRDELREKGRQIFWPLLRPEDADRLRLWEEPQWLQGRSELGTEVTLQLPGNSNRLLWVSGTVRTDTAGRPCEIYGMVTDITERRELEEAARAAVLRLREFSRTMPGAGMIIDATGLVVEWFDDNGLLSVDTSSGWQGCNLAAKLPAETAERLLHSIAASIAQDRLHFGEYALETEHGRRIFDVRIAPISYIHAGHKTIACFLSDVTDQIRTKQLLELAYEQQRQRDLLNGLAEGEIRPTQEILDQAWQVKLNLAQDFSCYLLVPQPANAVSSGDWRQRREALQLIAAALATETPREAGLISWESKDGIAVLLPAAGTEPMSREQELTQAWGLQQLISLHAPFVHCSIGIAEFHADTFRHLAKVYAQAQTAVTLCGKQDVRRSIYHYLDIGVFQFFPAIRERGPVEDFVRRMLGKLEQYDRQQGTQLIETLGQILQTGNLKTASERLFVHRQTILFRKQRIESLLNVSLDNFEVRLALGMALKFRQVFRDHLA